MDINICKHVYRYANECFYLFIALVSELADSLFFTSLMNILYSITWPHLMEQSARHRRCLRRWSTELPTHLETEVLFDPCVVQAPSSVHLRPISIRWLAYTHVNSTNTEKDNQPTAASLHFWQVSRGKKSSCEPFVFLNQSSDYLSVQSNITVMTVHFCGYMLFTFPSALGKHPG